MAEKIVAINEQGNRIGEGHPNAKHHDGMVELVLYLRDEDWGYKRIARVTGMAIRTVRCICGGLRRCQTPARYKRVRVSDEVEG